LAVLPTSRLNRFGIIYSLTIASKLSGSGIPLLRIKDWKNGIATLAVLPKDGNYAAVVNYMEKYISKEGNIGYCQKRYYRTRNLDFKNKSIIYANADELDELVQSLGLEAVKDNDKMTVYRKKQNGENI
jgi:hypothetical protein